MGRVYKSVWDALDFDEAETEELKIKSRLMIEIERFYVDSGLTQKEAAKKLGATQSRLNDILKGRIEKCTIDRLVKMLASIGKHVSVTVEDKKAA